MRLSRLLKLSIVGIVISSSLIAANASKMPKMFQSVKPSEATLVQKGKTKKFCPICGMTLPMFYKTNHSAMHKHEAKQYCSIHCVVEDIEKNKSNLEDIKVVDITSLKFIDVSKAFYVVGSKKKGTMSMVSKYAFAKKDDAVKFAKDNGGTVMDFNATYAEAKKDFIKDTMMVGKKQARASKMGEKLFNKKCRPLEIEFKSVAEAKAYVTENKTCGKINPKQLQAIGIYLGKK